MYFTQRVFKGVQPLLESICKHPFNVELSLGTLGQEQFAFYMQQDSMYLIEFARAFATLSGRCRQEADITLLLEFSHGALVAERSLHNYYFKEFFVPEPVANGVEKAPACLAYTGYLLDQAHSASVPVAMATLLPCFWVYREVGRHILAKAVMPNPYEKWIETYASKEFSDVVELAVAFTDKIAKDAGQEEISRMEHAFMTATRLEYYFWDGAYNCLQLPI